jgi:predicted ferric reductase
VSATVSRPAAPTWPPAPSLAFDDRHARLDARVRTAAYVVWGLCLLAVVVPWVADGGLTDLLSPTEALTSVGRLTGLVGAQLLLVQVLLMARVPFLEHAFGRDRLTRAHRTVGFTSFTLVLAHVVLITWGYASGAVVALPRMLWTLVTSYPGMLLAAAGTVAIVLVSLTSVRAARRRMRYESWHLLHLYAYLGAGLALPHQLWTGQQFVSRPALTAAWWAMWAVAAGAALCWRLLLPLWRTLRHDLRVSSVVSEGPGVVSVYLHGRGLGRLRVRAGQFATWRFLGRSGWTRGHPYSLSAAPDGRSLRITVREQGDGSAGASSLRPGTRVAFEGPFGRLSHRARTRRKLAFIGAGVGVTPLRALVEELAYASGDAVLLHRFQGHPLFRGEFATLERERGLQYVELAGRRRHDGSWLPQGTEGWSGPTALLHLVPDIAERDVFVCGPESWMDAVAASLRQAGVPDRHVHLERFSW